jgi:hypothetical protein
MSNAADPDLDTVLPRCSRRGIPQARFVHKQPSQPSHLEPTDGCSATQKRSSYGTLLSIEGEVKVELLLVIDPFEPAEDPGLRNVTHVKRNASGTGKSKHFKIGRSFGFVLHTLVVERLTLLGSCAIAALNLAHQ